MNSTRALVGQPARAIARHRGASTTAATVAAGSGRNDALDFTKGSLVLIMVLYHWLNYFVTLEWDVYRYLRFLTPSFIFITGFIVSQVYLGQQMRAAPGVGRRLLKRGAKLLLLFVVLNVLASLVTSSNRVGSSVTTYVNEVYVTGNGKAAFDVLVPISYFLLLAPLVLFALGRARFSLVLLAAVGVALASAASLTNRSSVNLELVAIAFLGMLIGTAPLVSVERWLERVPLLLVTYGLYLWAITVWNVIFPLQVVGVCLSLLFIYLAGVKSGSDGPVQRAIIDLGKYSLFAYIFQVFLLQVLRGALRRFDLHGAQALIPFVVTLVLTVAAVELVDLARKRSGRIDRLYRVVFA